MTYLLLWFVPVFRAYNIIAKVQLDRDNPMYTKLHSPV